MSTTEEGPPLATRDGTVSGLSPKARRTRKALAEAARTVFARDGFLDARITDIAGEAGVAHGTFYTYFESKEAIFREMVLGIQVVMTARPESPPPGDDPEERIKYANLLYITTYRENAALMATLEQVVTFNEDIRQLRKEIRRPFLERNIRAIRRWQGAGLADPELDPEYAASALGAMVDRFMYTWMVLGEDYDEEKAITTLSRIWVQALGIKPAKDQARQGSGQ